MHCSTLGLKDFRSEVLSSRFRGRGHDGVVHNDVTGHIEKADAWHSYKHEGCTSL